jgi:hypothetical protein
VSENRANWLAYALGIIVTLVVLAIGLTFIAWLWWPYKPFTWNQPNALHVNGPVVAGNYATYHVDVCKNYDDPMSVQRDIIAVNRQSSYPLVPVNSVVKHGCGKANLTIFIPPTLPPGQYFLRDAVTWRANPVRSVTVTTQSPSFTVLAKETST